MKFILAMAALMASSLSFAVTSVDLKKVGDDSCAKSAGKLLVRYTQLFDLGPAVKIIRFDSFENTTPGSMNQEYAAEITLVHTDEVAWGTNTSKFKATFSSPFICDDLKFLSVENLGVDESGPLFHCLNNNPEIKALQDVESAAFDAHLNAVAGTPEKAKLMEALKAAQKAVSDANIVCFNKFPLE